MHRDHFGPHQAHTKDVWRLTFNIFRPHVNAALQAQQRAGQRRGHAVLTGAGFGNNFGFAHPFCQQRLAEHLISLMRAAVQQIFTFEIQGSARTLRQVTAAR